MIKQVQDELQLLDEQLDTKRAELLEIQQNLPTAKAKVDSALASERKEAMRETYRQLYSIPTTTQFGSKSEKLGGEFSQGLRNPEWGAPSPPVIVDNSIINQHSDIHAMQSGVPWTLINTPLGLLDTKPKPRGF